jgi:hypothetical protein
MVHVSAGRDLKAVAPLLCAGITTYSRLRHWQVGPGRKVGVIGVSLCKALDECCSTCTHSLLIARGHLFRNRTVSRRTERGPQSSLPAGYEADDAAAFGGNTP